MKKDYSEENVHEFMFRVLEYFGSLSEELKSAIIDMTDIKRFRKNEVMAGLGTVCANCYFSYSGYVKGYKMVDDKQLVQWFMGPGKIIIRPESFHTQALSNGWIKAIEKVIAVELTYGNFTWLVDKFPEFKTINDKAVLYYYTLAEEREEMKGKNPEVNLEKLIRDNPGILEIASEEDIASYLGIDRKTLFRIKKMR
ncbi:Crp/Fnr family transcriptional regulator [Chitinophaga niabensis]|uniref:cAMP-binding domain of CRP or a regulatory subunit of cAMP-dependent protein kinases n=1 Tax=Chitinophaga niabensis TaxID=536979 RepID=A0A1N6JY29_9BACT|nr:Crp/Fnr family transcriptional regulator [Chitinophaga niabensis]SIO49238.1 cAMP-binding domain of CRP or a regulatory subunit of cAMP-dependent protein kinases [Chitinophaga niabensis]